MEFPDERLRIRVAIVTFRSATHIPACLDSLAKAAAELRDRAVLDIRVVDNASDDATCEIVARDHPEVTLTAGRVNSGFAVATNASLRDLDFDLALVLNPDTALRPGVLDRLLDDLEEEPRVGVVGCRLELLDGSFDHAAKRNLPRMGSSVRYLTDRLRGRSSRSEYVAPELDEWDRGPVEAVNGAFMLIRREALASVGLLDEGFWMYGEDLDWCRRFVAAGWEVLYDGTVTALHLKGASSGTHRSLRLDWHFHRSMVRYHRRARSRHLAFADPVVVAGVLAHLGLSQGRAALARRRSRAGRRRFVLDALASPAQGGGMRMHAFETIEAWQRDHPDDDLVVLGPAWARADITPSPRTRHLTWPNDHFALRVIGEFVVAPLVALRHPRHAFVSLSPVVSPLLPRRRAFAVAHDWRHLVNHDEYSRAQHLYRRQWKASLHRARVVFAISDKTARETRAVDPRARVVVVENGRDHPARWAVGPHRRTDDGALRIVTFGHKNNKRPELVVAALAHLDPDTRPRLTVLGAAGGYRDELAGLAHELGVAAAVEFPGFVDEPTYRGLVAAADVVAFASSDEGFGLPIAETEWFGGTAVIASDSGLAEIHPRAVAVPATPEGFADGIRTAATRRAAGPPATVWSWADVVAAMRSTVTATLPDAGR